jgi:hypothetical protein
MGISARQTSFAAVLFASCGLLPAVGWAQALALSYNLNTTPHQAYPPVSLLDRCGGGLQWIMPLAGPCNIHPPSSTFAYHVSADSYSVGNTHQAVSKVETRDSRNAVRRDSPEATAPAESLPLLGSTADTRFLRMAGGKDALTGNVKTVDLMFRFGPKYRVRSSEEGWEIYKFTDVVHENRITTNAKALGVELLFPFQ